MNKVLREDAEKIIYALSKRRIKSLKIKNDAVQRFKIIYYFRSIIEFLGKSHADTGINSCNHILSP